MRGVPDFAACACCCLQLGISQNALLYISSSSTEEDDDVRLELQQLLPRSARAVLAHVAAAAPGRLTSQHQQQRHVAGSRTDATTGIGVSSSSSSSTKPQSPLAKAKSSPLMKNLNPLGSSNLFSALQGGSSARVLAAAAAARPGSGGSASSQGETLRDVDALTQQQQQQQQQRQLAALGFGIERFDGDLVKLLR
jgi:hypothetical protein